MLLQIPKIEFGTCMIKIPYKNSVQLEKWTIWYSCMTQFGTYFRSVLWCSSWSPPSPTQGQSFCVLFLKTLLSLHIHNGGLEQVVCNIRCEEYVSISILLSFNPWIYLPVCFLFFSFVMVASVNVCKSINLAICKYVWPWFGSNRGLKNQIEIVFFGFDSNWPLNLRLKVLVFFCQTEIDCNDLIHLKKKIRNWNRFLIE